MNRRLPRPVPFVALFAALGAGFALAAVRPERAALAAEPAPSIQPARMIAVDAQGRAIVIDQSNMAYVVNAATAEAKLITTDRGEPLRVR